MARKPRSPPTPGQLERMMKPHLSFEINRFRNSASLWVSAKYGPPYDAMIRESCLLHFRLLLDFFYPRGDPSKTGYEDIFVSDYLPDRNQLSAAFQKLLQEPIWLEEYRDMLDWRLAHLTRKRLDFEKSPHCYWNPVEQFGHIEQLIIEFLNALPSDVSKLFDPTCQA